MKQLALIVLLLFALSPASPVSTHGQLSVVNGKIVDSKGNPPQLRGMSHYWYGPNWGGEAFYTQGVVNTLANEWKVGVIRAAIWGRNLNMAKSMIDWAIAAGIYVIIDNHSYCANGETSQVASYFNSVSAYVKQKGNPPNVIYEIFNEPVRQGCNAGVANDDGSESQPFITWPQIKSFAQTVIPSIRSNDANNLIVVGTPQWSQDVNAAMADPLSGANIAYALHFYASDDDHQGLMNRMKYVSCQKFPIFVTEWGTPNANGDGNINWSRVNAFVSMMESLKLSWASWAIGNWGQSSAALNGGSLSNLTANGNWMKSALINLANGTNVSGVSSSSVDCSVTSSSSTRTGNGTVDYTTQAENYSTMVGATELAGNNSMSNVYLGNLSSGSSATYNITANVNGVYMFWIRLASTAATNTVTVSSGTDVQEIQVSSTGGMGTWKDFKGHIGMKQGTQTLTVSFKGTAGTVNFDAFAFSIPDSLDTLALGLNLSSKGRNFQNAAKSDGLRYSWHASQLQIQLDPRMGFKRMRMFSPSGASLGDYALTEGQSAVDVNMAQLGDSGFAVFVLDGDRGRNVIQIPIVNGAR